jgi:6-phosphogluconolactonase
MSAGLQFREFADRSAASAAAANLLAGALRRALEKSGEASLVVSGGITPQECFLNLSRQVLDWSSVTIVPSDERWVEAHNLSSNEHLIHTRLMLGPASAARLLSFYLEELEAEEAPEVPFACALLGMGEDGHFASLFPDFEGLEEALDPDNGDQCVVVKTAGSPYLRISLTLPALLDSHAIVLLFFGEAKRRVFEAAAAGDSTYPVAALLSQDKVPVTVIWAP